MGEVVRDGGGRQGGRSEAASEGQVVPDVEAFEGRARSDEGPSGQEAGAGQTGTCQARSGPRIGTSFAGEKVQGSIGGPPGAGVGG